jgi:hypothetical protein
MAPLSARYPAPCSPRQRGRDPRLAELRQASQDASAACIWPPGGGPGLYLHGTGDHIIRTKAGVLQDAVAAATWKAYCTRFCQLAGLDDEKGTRHAV